MIILWRAFLLETESGVVKMPLALVPVSPERLKWDVAATEQRIKVVIISTWIQSVKKLVVSPEMVRWLIKAGIIKTKQILNYAAWITQQSEWEKSALVAVFRSMKKNGKAQIQIKKNSLNY